MNTLDVGISVISMSGLTILCECSSVLCCAPYHSFSGSHSIIIFRRIFHYLLVMPPRVAIPIQVAIKYCSRNMTDVSGPRTSKYRAKKILTPAGIEPGSPGATTCQYTQVIRYTANQYSTTVICLTILAEILELTGKSYGKVRPNGKTENKRDTQCCGLYYIYTYSNDILLFSMNILKI